MAGRRRQVDRRRGVLVVVERKGEEKPLGLFVTPRAGVWDAARARAYTKGREGKSQPATVGLSALLGLAGSRRGAGQPADGPRHRLQSSFGPLPAHLTLFHTHTHPSQQSKAPVARSRGSRAGGAALRAGRPGDSVGLEAQASSLAFVYAARLGSSAAAASGGAPNAACLTKCVNHLPYSATGNLKADSDVDRARQQKPIELGEHGTLDLQKGGWALRLRWSWLLRTSPS
ncbi:hypothetical protein ZWY2020_056624 [Hordeum vulgare]|nr:hypothetical protein ZWY2020_056624 [Hordeum vulgare]